MPALEPGDRFLVETSEPLAKSPVSSWSLAGETWIDIPASNGLSELSNGRGLSNGSGLSNARRPCDEEFLMSLMLPKSVLRRRNTSPTVEPDDIKCSPLLLGELASSESERSEILVVEDEKFHLLDRRRSISISLKSN
jgi:hypothetical protein